MIHRRHFIGSMAAAGFIGASSHSSLANQIIARTVSHAKALSWQCDIINTLPHGKGKRAPVVTGVSLQPTTPTGRGNLIAIVGDDHYVCIYDLKDKVFKKHIGDHSDWVRTTAFSPDGKTLASAGNDRKLRFWNADDWSVRPRVIRHNAAIIDIAFSNDSRRIATVGFENKLRVYDVQNDRQLFTCRCDCSDNHAVAFNHDGSLIAAGGRSGDIHVWDSNGTEVSSFKVHRQRIRSVQFTGDGRIVSCGDDQQISVTDPKKPKATKSLPRHAAKLYDVIVLDDQTLATSGSDNLIHIWRINDAKELGVLKGHTGTVTSLDASEHLLASGSYDTQVRVWRRDPTLGKDRQTFLPDGWKRRLN